MGPLEVEQLLEKYCSPAILVHRVYPPIDMPNCNSHLGGLPSLPPEFDWPRTSQGKPLHFLAQIDCLELPARDDLLPKSGTLFFFAAIDEMDWGKGSPQDDCRVIYSKSSNANPRSVPVDLAPIMAGHSALEALRIMPGDPPANIYPKWPITLHAIRSWPNWDAIPNVAWETKNAIQEAVGRARAAEVVRVLGLPLISGPRPGWGSIDYQQRTVNFPADVLNAPFPQVWVMVDRIMQNLVKQISGEVSAQATPVQQVAKSGVFGKLFGKAGATDNTAVESAKSQTGNNLDYIAIHQRAIQWIELASKIGLDKAPSHEQSKEFSIWLKSIAILPGPASAVGIALRCGMASAIQFAARSPAAASLIPPRYFNEAELDHIPVHASKVGKYVKCEPWSLTGQYHQMLGNGRSSQNARSVDRDEVLLLQLISDRGVEFMFCDIGEVEFWINKEDLQLDRFENAFGTTCGG